MYQKRSVVAVAALLLVAAPLPLAAQRTMGLMYHDSTRSYQGYTLFAPMAYTMVYLIDNQGRLVHSWDASRIPDLSVYLLEDGSLLHTTGPDSAGLHIRDWDDNVTWSFDCQGDSFHSNHDAEVLPNGNILLLVSEVKSAATARAAGRDTAELREILSSNYIIEVDTSNNEIVWEWHAWDHLIQDFDSTKQNHGVVGEHPELIDINYGKPVILDPDPSNFIHANSVDYNAELDQVITSSLLYSEVWVIDHSTTTEQARGHTGGRYGRGGDLLYRWGNPAAYRRGDSLSHWMFWQHDAQWISDSLSGAGQLLAFSNGGVERQWSQILQWVPPTDSPGFYHLGPDSAYGPREPTWSYRDTVDFYSFYISGCQRLPNGNTLICEGAWGTLFEVTPDSEVVWMYISPVSHKGPLHQGEPMRLNQNPVFRCYRYSPDYPAFEGRNLTPGDPIELPPVGVAEPGPAGVPAGIRLCAAPSTVRRRAKVALSLPGPTDVELAVYDSRGGRVAALVRGFLPAGEHRLDWDASAAAAGVYFCRLHAGESTSSVKLLKLD